VCGDCVREAHLSFRSEAAPLDGLLFRPLQQQGHGQQEVAAALLACVKPGRFLQAEAQALPAPTEPARTTSDRVPAHAPDLRAEAEDVQRRTTLILAVPEIPQRVAETEKIASTPGAKADTENKAIAQTGKASAEEDEDEGEEVRPHAAVGVLRVIERVLIIVALDLLLAIIALVIVAQTSDSANTLILQVLHVDIRAEVAYLVHLVQQLRQ
jgi:hypothetical protein